MSGGLFSDCKRTSGISETHRFHHARLVFCASKERIREGLRKADDKGVADHPRAVAHPAPDGLWAGVQVRAASMPRAINGSPRTPSRFGRDCTQPTQAGILSPGLLERNQAQTRERFSDVFLGHVAAITGWEHPRRSAVEQHGCARAFCAVRAPDGF